ncbi:hypothetical protein F5Y18DRAFT_441469 [Xylariaceae sp. FL1019]|nr:hypothetical protein F5Y18DRAFT_441469 [Xylariaceae sp. FL1019]
MQNVVLYELSSTTTVARTPQVIMDTRQGYDEPFTVHPELSPSQARLGICKMVPLERPPQLHSDVSQIMCEEKGCLSGLEPKTEPEGQLTALCCGTTVATVGYRGHCQDAKTLPRLLELPHPPRPPTPSGPRPGPIPPLPPPIPTPPPSP